MPLIEDLIVMQIQLRGGGRGERLFFTSNHLSATLHVLSLHATARLISPCNTADTSSGVQVTGGLESSPSEY